MSPADRDRTLTAESFGGTMFAHAKRVKVGGGRFGWWIGVIRWEHPAWDVWYCDHKHTHAKEARECVVNLFNALKGVGEPLRFRND